MQKKVVSKFGGSSMQDIAAMTRSANICLERGTSIVLVSATYGTTNKLIELMELALSDNWFECEKSLFSIQEKHFKMASQITSDPKIVEEIREYLNQLETLVRGINLLGECTLKSKDKILSFGERISSLIFSNLLSKLSKKEVILLDIRETLITDKNHSNATPLFDIIDKKAAENIHCSGNRLYVTQGFIGSSQEGATTTLGRGGSDYSASIIASAINADVLEIWTDVAGISSTDPRICESAEHIKEISYNEASEMAQYGAKILHPTTIVPAMKKNIPVFVGSSFDSKTQGTWIRSESEHKPLVRALTKRENQILVTLSTPKMLNAYGFMADVFSVFKKYGLSIDCVTTSEISIAISLDHAFVKNTEFVDELKTKADVKIEYGFSLISIIGNRILTTPGLASTLFSSIQGVNIRMFCIGASQHNMNILVQSDICNETINKIHNTFFRQEDETPSGITK